MNNQIWVIETRINGQYSPYKVEASRDNARALQRYLKATKSLCVPSRIRKYAQDPMSRG